MATLYVVGAPAGDPEDLTLRAQQTLARVSRVVAERVDAARWLLAHHGIDTPLGAVGDVESLHESLGSGDLALLCDGREFGPPGPAARLILEAAEQGVAIVPIPGPVLPLTALILSGLPADTFVYLGWLPAEAAGLQRLLSAVTSERRTLVAQIMPEALEEALPGILELLGDRPLAMVAAGEGSGPWVWRGVLADAVERLDDLPQQSSWALVMGGRQDAPAAWDESRLRAEVASYLREGLGVKEISQRLSEESGWARRDVYALAVRVHRGLRR